MTRPTNAMTLAMPSPTRRASLRRRIPVLAAAAALVLAGCSDDGTSINEQMRQGDQKGYIRGSGLVEQLSPEQRATTIELEGTTLEDEPWSSQEHLGEVVVINVWGSWCGPCVDEMPDLIEVSEAFTEAGEPVRFIGVNVRDAVPSAQAFVRSLKVPYESLQDDGGRTRAQLGALGVATPSTIVVAPDGKVAARVSGPVEGSTLRGLVEDVLAEGGS